MIYSLRGKIIQCEGETAVLEVNGVGFEVQINSRTLAALLSLGELARLYTHLQVLDNDLKLFGFLHPGELKLFKTLLGVSGIGTRSAMNLLGTMEPEQFVQAIVSRDEKTLVTIPGIGKKTAQRLLFELKDKIDPGLLGQVSSKEESFSADEILEALEALGYSRSEVWPILLELKENGKLVEGLEANIKIVLQRIAAQMKK